MTITIETNADPHRRDYIQTTVKLECTAPGTGEDAIKVAEKLLADVRSRYEGVRKNIEARERHQLDAIDASVSREVERNPGCFGYSIADTLGMERYIVEESLLRLKKAGKVHEETMPSLLSGWYKGPSKPRRGYSLKCMAESVLDWHKIDETLRDLYTYDVSSYFVPYPPSLFAACIAEPKLMRTWYSKPSIEDRVFTELKLAGKGEGRGRTFLEHKLCLPIDVVGAALDTLESAGKISSYRTASNVLLYVAK